MKSHIHPFPSKEAERHEYYKIVCPYLLTPANASRLGILSSFLTEIDTTFTAYHTIFPLSQNPDTRTQTIVAEKNIADKELQKILRKTLNDLPKSRLTAQDRNTLNLPERAKRGSLHHKMESVPKLIVDMGNRLLHNVWMRDENNHRGWGKPKGVRACQLWIKVGGTPPVDEKELSFVGAATKSPYRVPFDGNDAGKTVYYWARWENNRGETGSWSGVSYATVIG